MLDQGLLSLASILLLIVAAQFGTSEQLGTFVLGLSTAVLIQSLSRAICGETLLVRSTQSDFSRNEVSAAVALALLIAGACVVICVVLSFVMPEHTDFYMSLGVAQLGLLFQDATRFAALTTGSSAGMLLTDGLYVAGSTLAIYTAGSAGAGSSGMLVALGISAGSVGAFAAFLFRIAPRFGHAGGWIRKNWRLNSSFVSEAALGAALGYSIVVVLNFLASGSDLAAYRATVSIFGLTSLAINFLRTIVLRDLRKESIKKSRQYWRQTGLMGMLVFFTVALTYVVLLVLPQSGGVRLFSDTWLLMTPLFAAAAINRFMAGLSVVPTIFLRVQGITWRATLVRIVITIIGFGLGPVGAWIAGAQGALLAEALSYLILTTALTILSRRVAGIGRHRSGSPRLSSITSSIPVK